MPIHNADIATMFNEIADLLDIQGDNPFRIRAYRKGARTIGDLPQNLVDMLKHRPIPKGIPGKRMPRFEAEYVVSQLLPYLQAAKGVNPVEAVESFRRCGGTVGDLDIPVSCTAGTERHTAFYDL